MTIDEAIKHCEDVAHNNDITKQRCDDASGYTRSGREEIRTSEAKKCEQCAADHRQLAEWLKDYKRLLAQEPCEDAISREDALMCMTGEYLADKEYKPEDIISKHIKRLRALPPVTPQPKTGHWIGVTNGRGGHECDLCHEYAPSYQSGDEWLTKYCPNCGAKMVEPQEREEA